MSEAAMLLYKIKNFNYKAERAILSYLTPQLGGLGVIWASVHYLQLLILREHALELERRLANEVGLSIWRKEDVERFKNHRKMISEAIYL